MNLLHVVSNPKPAAEANSKQLSEAFFKALREKNPGVVVTEVDLNANPPPFYSYEMYRYFWYPVFNAAYPVSDKEKMAAKYALEQCRLFSDSDVVVLTSPMWNFSVPAILKAWIDQVIMPNHTFAIGAGGVKALHRVRKIVLLASSGGVYEPEDKRECLAGEIRAAFGFAGVTDIEVAWSQGQNPLFFKDFAERKAKALLQAADLGRKVAQMG